MLWPFELEGTFIIIRARLEIGLDWRHWPPFMRHLRWLTADMLLPSVCMHV